MKKILLIDDNAIVRTLLSTTFSMSNVTILEADNGLKGLALAKSELPDLIFLDIRMPDGLDGLEVCRELKNTPETKHILVILLSAVDERNRAKEVGADGFILKPFSPRELLDCVHGL